MSAVSTLAALDRLRSAAPRSLAAGARRVTGGAITNARRSVGEIGKAVEERRQLTDGLATVAGPGDLTLITVQECRELVKSLGLAQQETERLNATTSKILKLELRKVRYLRSLSFVQGTFVNLLRNVIVLLLLYLLVQHHISLGQFFSFFIYSFSIFILSTPMLLFSPLSSFFPPFSSAISFI